MAITYEDTFQGRTINTDKNRKLGCRTNILQRNKELLDGYLEAHSKCLVTRFDIASPKGYSEGQFAKAVSDTLTRCSKDLSRQGYDPQHMQVKEGDMQKGYHVHAYSLCNGHKIQHPKKVHECVVKHYSNQLGYDASHLVHFCNKSEKLEDATGHYNLRKCDSNYEQQYDECFHRLSYLAKDRSKGNTGKHFRDFSSSRPKKKSK